MNHWTAEDIHISDDNEAGNEADDEPGPIADDHTDPSRRDPSLAQFLDEFLELAELAHLGPEGWFLVIICNRSSSTRGRQCRPLMRRRERHVARLYDQRLARFSDHVAEFRRPGNNNNSRMLNFNLYCERHGNSPVPWTTLQLRGRRQRQLRRFVRLMRFLYQTPCPVTPPLEVHFLLGGLAGLSVEMRGWGDAHAGFWREIFNGNPALAKRTYLVPHIEDHLVTAGRQYCLNIADWPVRYREKRLRKIRLIDAINDDAQRRFNRLHNLPPPNPPSQHEYFLEGTQNE